MLHPPLDVNEPKQSPKDNSGKGETNDQKKKGKEKRQIGVSFKTFGQGIAPTHSWFLRAHIVLSKVISPPLLLHLAGGLRPSPRQQSHHTIWTRAEKVPSHTPSY